MSQPQTTSVQADDGFGNFEDSNEDAGWAAFDDPADR